MGKKNKMWDIFLYKWYVNVYDIKLYFLYINIYYNFGNILNMVLENYFYVNRMDMCKNYFCELFC